MIKIFNVWRFVIGVAWAKSFTWAVTTEKETRQLFFSIHKVTRDGDSALCFIFLPISITVGYVNSPEVKSQN